jgi:hypothetical protein
MDIRRRLRAGTEIRGWSRDQEDTGLRFKIVDVGADAIAIKTTPSTQRPRPTERRIGKSDFARVYGMWKGYCDGKINRTDIPSQNTSYIFSIFRWRERTEI